MEGGVGDFVRETLANSGEERVPARREAEDAARELLGRSAGEMSEEEFRQLFALFNSDSQHGVAKHGRFSPAFIGSTANQLVRDLDALNRWTARIWLAGEEDALAAVDELLADGTALPGAGTTYPTMLMYIRDPRKWAVWGPSTDRGLRNLGGDGLGRRPGSGRLADYLAFSSAAIALGDRYEIAPEELDYVLAAANQPAAGIESASEADPARAWIFQANPKYYEIDRALRELPAIEWRVRQYPKQVRAGHRAYIWRSGAQAGIVALGSVLTNPAESAPDPAEEPYYVDRSQFSESELRVRIGIEQVLEQPILVEALESDPVLKNLGILGFRNATIFDVTPEQDQRLQQLVAGIPGRRYWWVNQGSDFEREREHGYITSPVYDKGGGEPSHWKVLTELQVGDIVLHYFRQQVAAVGTVTSPPVTGVRPADVPETGWGEEGHLVRLDYRDLETPIRLADIPLAWRQEERGPFQSGGAVNQGYCYPLSSEFVARMADRFPQLEIDVSAIATSGGDRSLSELVASIRAAGLRISDDVIRRYHLSLQTRGFVILAGVSGTGKTWLAEEYAKAIDASWLLVPVAPNWTTNEDLLGYLNPLDQQYHNTEFSLFLRAASGEYERARNERRDPRIYSLILDEMNLARVEYYFAKFLSAMELRARSEDATIELAPNNKVSLPPKSDLHRDGQRG